MLNQINGLAAKRDAYLKNSAAPAKGGFDGKVRETVKKQAADIGLLY